ncbi:radical SAM protein [Neobacillus notoginsengisoli]|uniref:Radical SAM protein n=1 Tax=Neobacillus notoginsengisoli TaxID=1578198 RepID=A0A417YZW5_9BACI|nr:radical SAM protein [Neobacillus notoginsengisoli]RHW43306.1 radical SAM protein [Neobacillus notoginsengisoli]
MKVLEFKFHPRVKEFEVQGIKMIGNLVNGSIIGLDDKGKKLIELINQGIVNSKESLDEEETQLIDFMVDRGFFTEEITNLKAAYVHLTDRCNLHCVGCYSFVEERNTKDVLPYDSICFILKQLKLNGAEQIVFSGGEPFIRKDIVDICKFAKNDAKITNLHVITNGTMDYEKYVDAFPFIDELNISIDGFNEETQFIRDKGIMTKVIKNINYLKTKVPVSLIATIHSQNIKYVDKYLQLSKELGVGLSFSIFTVDPNDLMFKDFIFDNKGLLDFSNKILNLDKNVQILDMPTGEFELSCRRSCEVGKELISIGADGSIYPCHMLHDEELTFGSIFEISLKEALSNSDTPFRNLEVDNVNGCKDCEYKYLCGGGCRGRSWLYSKSFHEKDSYCPFIKNYYRNTISRLKESLHA